MNIAFYTGVSGMIAYQQEMDLTAHNIANVRTAGYKESRSSFSDLMYTEMNTNVEGEHLTGHGVRMQNTDLMYGQAGLNRTEFPLDFALLGDGFFAVDRGGEAPEYTRNGAFNLTVSGKNGYLTTSDGGYVLDRKGKAIKLSMKKDGSLDLEGITDKIGVYSFPNPYGLARADASSFRETDISGEAKAIVRGKKNETPYQLISGSLEVSAVELGDEMVNVIQSQRAFQFNSRMVQTADQMEEIINNLR